MVCFIYSPMPHRVTNRTRYKTWRIEKKRYKTSRIESKRNDSGAADARASLSLNRRRQRRRPAFGIRVVVQVGPARRARVFARHVATKIDVQVDFGVGGEVAPVE